MTIELVVFDIAGTTVRDDDLVLRGLMSAFRRHRIPADERAVNGMMGIPKPDVIERTIRGSQPELLDGDTAQAVFSTFQENMRTAYRGGAVHEIAGATAAFGALRAAGMKVALDTGFDRSILDLVLERLGWDDRVVDCAVASDEVPRGRPYPYLIFRAMEHCGVASVRAVAKFGDTPADIDEGRNAGCAIVCAVLSGAHDRRELERHGPTHILPSVASAADLLLGAPARG